jgi:MFS family permease
VQGLGYFLPTTYLSLYCTRLALPDYSGPLLLSLINLVSAPSGVVIGALNDRWGVGGVIGLCAAGSALTVLLLWGLGSNFATLVAFSIGYGFFAGGYSSTWSGIVVAMNGGGNAAGGTTGSPASGDAESTPTNSPPEAAQPSSPSAPSATHPSSPASPSPSPDESAAEKNTQTSLLFGLLAGGRGLGNVLSGPLSAALLEAKWAPDHSEDIARIGGYATEYGPLILFTGVSALLGGWGFWGRGTRQSSAGGR